MRPIGVPGPTRVRSSFSWALIMVFVPFALNLAVMIEK
jgi:hypothetical protein